MMYPYHFRPMFPYYNYRRYSSYDREKDNLCNSVKEDDSSYVNTKKTCCNDTNCSDDSPTFNFLGVNFHFDDLLLIALIYFLYTEDVHDPELFIALILLLLS